MLLGLLARTVQNAVMMPKHMFRYQQQKCVTCLWLYEDKVMIVVDHRKCRFTQFILLFGTVSLHI